MASGKYAVDVNIGLSLYLMLECCHSILMLNRSPLYYNKAALQQASIKPCVNRHPPRHVAAIATVASIAFANYQSLASVTEIGD